MLTPLLPGVLLHSGGYAPDRSRVLLARVFSWSRQISLARSCSSHRPYRGLSDHESTRPLLWPARLCAFVSEGRIGGRKENVKNWNTGRKHKRNSDQHCCSRHRNLRARQIQTMDAVTRFVFFALGFPLNDVRNEKKTCFWASVCECVCVSYPACSENSGSAPREVSCSSRATMRRPMYPEDNRSRTTLKDETHLALNVRSHAPTTHTHTHTLRLLSQSQDASFKG